MLDCERDNGQEPAEEPSKAAEGQPAPNAAAPDEVKSPEGEPEDPKATAEFLAKLARSAFQDQEIENARLVAAVTAEYIRESVAHRGVPMEVAQMLAVNYQYIWLRRHYWPAVPV